MARRNTKTRVSEKLRQACLHWLSEYGKVDDVTKRTVERGLQKAWESRDPYLPYTALQFIFDQEHTSSASQAVLALALRSKHPSMVGNAQSAAFLLGFRHHQEFEPPLLKALRHLVQHGVFGSERWLALQILDYSNESQPWIAEFFPRTKSPELRLEAARILLRHGSPIGKEVLLDDLRVVADEVWARRDVLGLNAAELKKVKRAVVRYMGSQRRRLHSKALSFDARLRAAEVLVGLASDGFPLTRQEGDP